MSESDPRLNWIRCEFRVDTAEIGLGNLHLFGCHRYLPNTLENPLSKFRF